MIQMKRRRLGTVALVFASHSGSTVNGFSSSCLRMPLPSSTGRPFTFPRHSSSCAIDLESEPSLLSQVTETAAISSGSNSRRLSDAAQWHAERRRQMIQKYGDQIAPLERQASSWKIGIPLLLLGNACLLSLSLLSGSLPIWAVLLLALFPGSMLSLWQLQILHDVLHGSFLPKKNNKSLFLGLSPKKLKDALLFWGSLPCYFGYYLYLKRGHLSHHAQLGDPTFSLAQLFESSATDFEDGDMLFVAHRMKLKGATGPTVSLPSWWTAKGLGKKLTMSISRSGFFFWKPGQPLRNAMIYAISFVYERTLLGINDVFVAVLGKNLFFPNKPSDFQRDCVAYARVATLLRASLLCVGSWKSLLFLHLSETLWSIPPHPACAMFVTNHGSTMTSHSTAEESTCIPTSSTYAGAWYSILTLGTNFHCEHHDFTSIPFQDLHKLHKIAPEYYPNSQERRSLWSTMIEAFAHPQFYACMDAGVTVK
jgi:fatty acid desaturase